MMKNKIADPTLERIHRARREISARYGHDIEKMIADYRRREIESENKTDEQNISRKKPVKKAA
ncbi:MAG: hypothetical protein LH472_13560 [Pyrinomonadaceae bacterium]|nr:hypothetical protein [Pyrinomonadaceae bacterium]